MIPRTVFGVWICGLALAGWAVGGTEREIPDRLDRFRQLAPSRLGALELSGHEPSEEVLREIYALLDDEIIESLVSGALFASEGFLQERLDAFNEVWGGAAFTIRALRGSGLMVGAFQLSPTGSGNSVRIYGRTGAGAGLVRTIHHAGVPVLHEMPPTRSGDPQFLVAWVGPQSGRGTTALRLELWRRRDVTVSLAWTPDAPPVEGFFVSAFSLRGQEVSFRYELRYPGWKPGCDRQTEQEDLYRYIPARETFTLVRRQVHEAWHREFHAGFRRFLSALQTQDDQALQQWVPDNALRARLPRRLEADPACDAADGPSPEAVAVAAVSTAETHPGHPWTLLFRRSARGWRLAAAGPVE